MNIIATIGQQDSSMSYTDRPTVKVLIRNDDKVLLLNQGLLPGGGIEPGESDLEAIVRELQEELGATVKDIDAIGTVLQWRNLITRRYIINGYTASLDTIGGPTNPQSEDEAQFTSYWLGREDAIEYVIQSIEHAKLKPADDAANQGKLYNLMSTLEFLRATA